MSTLFKAFYLTELQFLKNLYNSFRTKALYNEILQQAKSYKTDPEDRTLYNEFKADVTKSEDLIYDHNPQTFEKVRVLQRINMGKIYERMNETERSSFWEEFINMCKYTSMLKACGKFSQNIESMAINFVKSHPDMKPQQFHQKVFEEMFNGGDMQKQFLSTFRNKGALKSVLKNVGGILRTPGGENVDLSELADEIKDTDLNNLDEEFGKLQQHIRETGVNPFATSAADLEEDTKSGFSLENPMSVMNQSLSGMMEKIKNLKALKSANASKDIKPEDFMQLLADTTNTQTKTSKKRAHRGKPLEVVSEIAEVTPATVNSDATGLVQSTSLETKTD